ncbi:cysteine desulfurase [Saccharopolyspora phatthalungensis]|uniref:Selenocysteine lyase/cysteine desulfurase n=1 Tax=Saccharopolyspora phatthalungensis TaxID=664693 RepID=A0A840QDZ8_9PSEU|nr:cysteine desulfurase [Saccharopolyspora phatthalungensis]MBB5156888.1 selenocysteine lyase/cysteine desulfurase [Saccharopolyspora phatthalungensis]
MDTVGLGRLLKLYRALFAVDGCQTVGNIDVDVEAMP